MITKAPYGSWLSPISLDSITKESISFGHLAIDDNYLYWTEQRPDEEGRNVIVQYNPKSATKLDLIPHPFNARTKVHEYGGASFLVDAETVYFSNWDDQRIYSCTNNSKPKPLTPVGAFRYADGVVDKKHKQIICIREDHSSQRPEPINAIVAIDINTGSTRVLVGEHNFYSNPRISPAGNELCWLAWNHPNMPWDGCELHVATIQEDGSIFNSRIVAGSANESIFQPEWSPKGSLHFVSDRSGWWNIYSLNEGIPKCVYETDAEFGMPLWTLGVSTYGFINENKIISWFNTRGNWQIGIIDLQDNNFTELKTPYTDLARIGLKAHDNKILIGSASPTSSAAISLFDADSSMFTLLEGSKTLSFPTEYISLPETIEIMSENNHPVHAFFYPPTNPDFRAPDNTLPPLIVFTHGGPTSATTTGLNLNVQFWTSRGFSVLDVNYGGSSGYGREYRRSLNLKWGIVDVDDCISAASHIVKRGNADPNRLAIRGGSAGGFTTLAALTFRDFFTAGTSQYGVTDLTGLANDTHKFESRYLDNLVGPFPEESKTYDERSPINSADQITCPVLILQGLEDAIVPPNQAERMLETLKENKIPVAYVPFPEEQHGFRKAANIQRSLEAELYFYSQVFKFKPAENLQPVKIFNRHKL
tara:strand:- start:1700 stop:3640 length:1941 start_codon:yes stop_codon:yes gene_type:complete